MTAEYEHHYAARRRGGMRPDAMRRAFHWHVNLPGNSNLAPRRPVARAKMSAGIAAAKIGRP